MRESKIKSRWKDFCMELHRMNEPVFCIKCDGEMYESKNGEHYCENGCEYKGEEDYK
jgi:hypothetical protein